MHTLPPRPRAVPQRSAIALSQNENAFSFDVHRPLTSRTSVSFSLMIDARDDLSHLLRVIATQLAHFAGEAPRVQRVEHRHDGRRLHLAPGNLEFVTLNPDWNDIQTISFC